MPSLHLIASLVMIVVVTQLSTISADEQPTVICPFEICGDLKASPQVVPTSSSYEESEEAPSRMSEVRPDLWLRFGRK